MLPFSLRTAATFPSRWSPVALRSRGHGAAQRGSNAASCSASTRPQLLVRSFGSRVKKKEKEDRNAPSAKGITADEANRMKVAQIAIDMRRGNTCRRIENPRSLTDDEMEERRKIESRYTREMMLLHNEHTAAAITRRMLSRAAIEALPTEELRAAAMEPETEPFPSNRYPPAYFPPSKGYNSPEQLRIIRDLRKEFRRAYKPRPYYLHHRLNGRKDKA